MQHCTCQSRGRRGHFLSVQNEILSQLRQSEADSLSNLFREKRRRREREREREVSSGARIYCTCVQWYFHISCILPSFPWSTGHTQRTQGCLSDSCTVNCLHFVNSQQIQLWITVSLSPFLSFCALCSTQSEFQWPNSMAHSLGSTCMTVWKLACRQL